VGAPYGTAAVAGYYSPLWNYVRTDSEIWTKLFVGEARQTP